jgi:RNA polymerase sigma factor (sigma-70 family)
VSALFRPRKLDFDGLYRRHAPSVYRYTFAVLGNRADAEDITQQTFLNAYRAIERGTKPRKPENWLLRIAHNEVRRYFKTNGRAVEVEFDEQLAHPVPEHSEPGLAEVLRALWQLPPTQRSALVMREFEGRSYAEIAELLDVTQSALEALLFRARRGLADHLEGALTCGDAEQALSRRLDGRLARRESRRLKAHLHDCARCVRFAEVQKRQRSLLKGLSVMPIPASLLLFRGEHAAAAGLGASTAAGAGGAGVGAGVLAKAAAVTAAATVVGGVGYDAATRGSNAAPAQRKMAQAVVVVPSEDSPARFGATPPSTYRAGSGLPATAHERRKAGKAKTRSAKPKPAAHTKDVVAADKGTARFDAEQPKPAFVVKVRRTKLAPVKSSPRGTRTRGRSAAAPGRIKHPEPKPSRPAPRVEKPKPPHPVDPLPDVTGVEPGPKKQKP